MSRLRNPLFTGNRRTAAVVPCSTTLGGKPDLRLFNSTTFAVRTLCRGRSETCPYSESSGHDTFGPQQGNVASASSGTFPGAGLNLRLGLQPPVTNHRATLSAVRSTRASTAQWQRRPGGASLQQHNCNAATGRRAAFLATIVPCPTILPTK